MRKLVLSLAAAGTALAFATPASAQYYPQPQPYGYNNGYGYNNYGYNNNGYSNYGYGYGRGQLQQELQQIRYQADNLARQGRLTRSEARDLFRDIHSAERGLYRSRMGRDDLRAMNEKIGRIRYELRRYADYDRGRYDSRYRRY